MTATAHRQSLTTAPPSIRSITGVRHLCSSHMCYLCLREVTPGTLLCEFHRERVGRETVKSLDTLGPRPYSRKRGGTYASMAYWRSALTLLAGAGYSL